MSNPAPIPASRFATRSLLREIESRPEALALFVLNVGDGDAQVALLPGDPVSGRRQAVVVDAATGKPLQLIDLLTTEGLLPGPNGDPDVALVVATHPHQDHIGGMSGLLGGLGDRVAEFWDPGYFHPIGAFHRMMGEVEQRNRLLYSHPSAGLRRWIGRTGVTVLSPSVHLRNRFDTYGVEINDSSISLRLEHPAARVVTRDQEGNMVEPQPAASVVLGGDAQTLSWSYVLTDFPFLMKSNSPSAAAIAAATGDRDLLDAQVFKVSHHASKRGVNLELLERIKPRVTVVSCAPGSPRYHFPHDLAQEILREARDPQAGSGAARTKGDWQLGIFYTADVDTGERLLGSVVTLVEHGRNPQVWRLGDAPTDTLDRTHLTKARRFS
jgi:beta-lactamase superfamily II metal-dependent hydrolase